MSSSPVGFARAYRRVRQRPAAPDELSNLLALVGYDAPPDVVARWPLDRRVEAEVYAVNAHLRASDNVLRRCPRPEWLPEPWLGPEDGSDPLSGPSGTRLA